MSVKVLYRPTGTIIGVVTEFGLPEWYAGFMDQELSIEVSDLPDDFWDSIYVVQGDLLEKIGEKPLPDPPFSPNT